MKTIYKYPVPVADSFSIFLPKGAEILTVQTQGEGAYVWAIVEPGGGVRKRDFCLRGTGHPLGDVGRYIGTFQLRGGSIVFHLFEGPTP